MVESPLSRFDGVIRRTIERYQATFNSGDRDGWLALFADDGVLEDPVGSSARRGGVALAAFWDEIHRDAGAAASRTVRMVQGPAVCGAEAAWAFELRIPLGERTVVVEIIDQAAFTEDGRIRQLRAFWNESTVRTEGSA